MTLSIAARPGLAVLLAIEVTAIVAAAWLSRDEPAVLRLALLALGFVVAAQIVFWTFTYPANLAPGQWTRLPDDWEPVRRRWEYSHAAGAACQILAMAAITAAAVRRR